MMKWMNSYIEIGNYIFRFCNEVIIEESLKSLTQQASIKLPNVKKVVDLIKVGDPVLIKLGYDSELKDEFKGFVTVIKPTTPIEIYCQDKMWKLKQTSINKSFRPGITLKEIIYSIISDATLNEIPDIKFGDGYRIENISIAKFLEKLQDDFGIISYYRNEKLFIGFRYFETGLPNVNYHFQKNIPFNESSLEFVDGEALKLKVKAISILENNERIEIELGDPEGELHTLHFPNLNAEALKIQAQNQIATLKQGGLKGDLVGFGLPKPYCGGVMNIYNNRLPKIEGSYFVNAITTTYNENGFRRRVTPGKKSNSSLT